MKINKKLFFKIHSWIGIKLSILFFIVCFSGTLATVSHELDWLFNPQMRVTPVDTLASMNTMIKNIEAAYPEARLFYIGATTEPYLSYQANIQIGDEFRYVFVNQHTGVVQGEANLTIQRYLRDLHYYLFIPFQVGHFTVLLFGFMLFISLVTALVFYKNWWRKLFELKRGNGPVVLFRSFHRLVGAWSVPFVILFSVTGIWYFVERTNLGGVSRIANPKTPKIEEIFMDSTQFAHLHYKLDYDRITTVAEAAIPNLVVGNIVPPRSKTAPIYVTGKSDVPFVRKRANRVYIHPVTYEVVGTQKAREIGTVTWLNDIADPLHFGYFGGLATKILWFLGGLGITFLVGSGIWISLKRKVHNARQEKAQRLGRWKYVNYGVTALMFLAMYIILFLRYGINASQFTTITFGWVGAILLAWYIYVKKIEEAR